MLKNKTYKYIFAPYLNGICKIDCPKCGSKKRFRLYVDKDTKKLLPPIYGRCDREDSCGHSYSPYEFPPNEDYEGIEVQLIEKSNYFDVIPKDVYKKTLNKNKQDDFSKFVLEKFGCDEILDIYRVGYDNLFGNSTVFWQIDKNYNIRSGKIMQYGADGKRVKTNGVPKIAWIHNKVKANYSLKQCFFGEHLLTLYPHKNVVVVESEKTCIIGSCKNNNLIWLGAGSMYGLSDEKLQVLSGRKVIFMPDKGKRTYNYWKEKITPYKNENWRVTDYLESKEELEIGEDYADLILRS